METQNKYNIGLDIGVGSVGWCVTDENGKMLKKGNRNLWGSRIFNEANPAQQTRIFRGARRRLDRRKERIRFLQSMLQEDIEKEYPNFFPMLRESSLDFEDKMTAMSISNKKYNLFSDTTMTDTKYYKEFPTIYHLRKYLVDTDEKVDIRLVYLAIHHILKYRGNFLYEGDFSNNAQEIEEKLDIICDFLEDRYEITLNCNKQEIIDIFQEKNIAKTEKKEKLMKCFNFEKSEKPIIENIMKSFLGLQFDLNKIFEIEIEKSKMSFAKELEDEVETEIKKQLQDNLPIYEAMNDIYSWVTLQDILKGKQYISEAFIEKYNKYQEDLKLLKRVYKEYFPKQYSEMFRKYNEKNKTNYVAYNKKNNGKTNKKCKPEEFLAILKKKIDELPDACVEKEKIKKEIEDNNFLQKLNVTENGAIPHQLHQKELNVILEHQSKYYKTIQENKENIDKLFCFRIPYYVGPLAKKEGKWSWIVRKEEGNIRPWNFGNIVDVDKTAEAFIKRMTNKCSYLPQEDVIPKQSLLYAKYCVLNELNNIRVNEKHIAKDMKRKIIEKLFQERKKVTKKALKDFYKKEGFMVERIDGLQDNENFMSNMESYIDMTKILGTVSEDNYEMCEKIIEWITIFEDKKILKTKVKKEYPELTNEQITKLAKLNYTGWSKLSKHFLTGLKAQDGETIMDKLENTTMNLMQIINSDKFNYAEQIEKAIPKKTGKITYEDVAEIPTSPANKRGIWQTICVVNELVKVMKGEPENIYIEFARSEDVKKQRKDSRKDQLLKKYKEIEAQATELKEYDPKVYKQLKADQNDKNLTEKMYLYYIQNGKCLYSRRPLNLDELDKYEVDHILPQSYIKDDGIENKALVIKEQNQRKKDSLLLSDTIINNQIEWWKDLLDKGLIGTGKYYRLIRRKMLETDYDKEKFVQRQLVETRQITKYVTNLLKSSYEDTEIYAIRAELTHNFREDYKIYKNRNVNNYHHAHDAYILSTIGNIIAKHWKVKENFQYGEYVKKYLQDEKSKYEKNGMIMGMIRKNVDIAEVKKAMEYKDCYISRKLEEGTGPFYKQTLYSPKEKPVISLKQGKAPQKYGGYSGENKAYL